MALTRLDNLYSSKTGKYLYVSPDDFNATDELDNRGNSPLRPFKTIQRAFIEVARFSYLPGPDNDRFDQFSIMLMPGDHYIDNRPGLVEIDRAGRQRYYDARNLITANRQEIIDRAFAEIAIEYDEVAWGTDWVVPGDDPASSKARNYDAYRLIQKNRQEIIDRSIAEISFLGPNEEFYFPEDPAETEVSRYKDAYRLIKNNQALIVDDSWNVAVAAFPAIATTETKCKRDLGYFIEAIALDVFTGGNVYSRQFVLQYFDGAGDPITNGINDPTEEAASILAFETARDFLQQAVANNYNSPSLPGTEYRDNDILEGESVYGDGNGDVSRNDPTACFDVQTTIANLTTTITVPLDEQSLTNLAPEVVGVPPAGEAKCKRDLGFIIDYVSLDVVQGGGNEYTRKVMQNYFNSEGTDWVDDGLQGETVESLIAFNKARDVMIQAMTNQLYYKDPTVTDSGDDGDPLYTINDCADINTLIVNLFQIVIDSVNNENLSALPAEDLAADDPGEGKCKRDIGYIVDAVAADLANGGNSQSIAAAKAYFDAQGNLIVNGVEGEEAQSVVAFNRAVIEMQKAVTNQLLSKDLTLLAGPADFNVEGPVIPVLPSGNAASCVDVQSTIADLTSIVTDTLIAGNLSGVNSLPITGDVPIFNYNQTLEEWNDNTILDLSNPDNALYKFNASTGGAIVPRGCSLIGYDLRRTIVRPLYVPDPVDATQERTSIFNLTGGCYLWQFTIKDGDLSSNSPLYDPADRVGKVYYQKGNSTALITPEYSHHKITIMEYADETDLDQYYEKVGRSFSLYQPTIDDGDLEALVQENRIVGPLSDTRNIINIRLEDNPDVTKTTVVVTTKIAHGYFRDQYVAIIDNGLNDLLNGTFKVTELDDENPRIFKYEVNTTELVLGLDINAQGYDPNTVPALNVAARVQAEIDSVESASPYVFNCSIRSTWGQCGMWADGSKATGFKSMVVAQYTGVSLQRDDRAYIRYDEFTNTWNQASISDAFATEPYHTRGDAYWKDDWRNFHIRASDDAFIQCVSVFAVGFFDHFLMESGGDMSITNSNSNFGNTSLHAIGFKGFAFNQDKGGYITDIIPTQIVDDSAFNEQELKYYSLDAQKTKDTSNINGRLYYGSDDVYDPFTRPAVSIDGFRLGAKTGDKVFLDLKSTTGTTEEYEAIVEPTGFLRYTVSLDTLNPDGLTIDNYAQDASNSIERNTTYIQQEAYGYITEKYPYLLTKPGIEIGKCERDIGYFVDAVVQDLRVGGNIQTVQAAEAYFVSGALTYIPGELNETVETLEYVKNLCIAAMRNFDYLIRDCQTNLGSAIVDVGDTAGLIIGMEVVQYDYVPGNFENGRLLPGATPTAINPAIPAGTYIKRIVDDTRIELGQVGSRLDIGNTVVALNTNSVYLYFSLPQTGTPLDDDDVLDGVWAAENPVRDSSIIQDDEGGNPPNPWAGDQGYPECVNIASTIETYFDDINIILNSGVQAISDRETSLATLILANKELIAEEALDRAKFSFAGLVLQDQANTLEQVRQTIDAYAFNVQYGANSSVYDRGIYYVANPSVTDGEEAFNRLFYDEVFNIIDQVIRNTVVVIAGDHGLQQVFDSELVGDLSGLPGDIDPSDFLDITAQVQGFTDLIKDAIGDAGVPGDLSAYTRTEPVVGASVLRVEPTLNTANLATRATIFTVNTGGGVSDPHNFETGTPVRLIPKAKEGTNPDKRVIRLPRGFETNTVYYVIAPGRSTQPENYGDATTYPGIFEPSSQTKLMLARTKDNAAAGIYIYSSETDSVDPEVEIELQQYVLDVRFDLHQYLTNEVPGQNDVLQTDVPHVFDVPGSVATVHKIFFRTFGSNSTLPQLTSTGAEVDPNTYYYARFVTPKTFSVFLTEAEAIAGATPQIFANGFGENFYVFSDKRRSPVKFDAEVVAPDTTTGQWYIKTIPDPLNTLVEAPSAGNIITRLQELGVTLTDARTKNTFYRRLKDERPKEDTVYRLRYVIPRYATGVRDPLNGFVIKARTDETRKLLPQRILLQNIASGDPVATFNVPFDTGGGTIQQKLGLPLGDPGLDPNFDYDPYDTTQTKTIDSDRTDSKIGFSILSARQIDTGGVGDPNDLRLELTVFNHAITNQALRNEKFVVVKINAPQGGSFRVDALEANNLNRITWSGYSKGAGYLQGYFSPTGTSDHYLIIKAIESSEPIEYSAFNDTVFAQPVLDGDNDPIFDINNNPVNIFATLQAKPNSAGNEELSKSAKEDYLYSDKNANILTMVPGDVIEDDTSTDYEILSVEDVGDFEDSFYIFDIDEIQRRIPNQQEGIYYLTCLRGNISPFPTGPGVGENFRNFKFSQPISQLYPLSFINDPLWFQVRPDGTRDTSIIDPPPTICAADNYVHGLVTTNETKNSETKEAILDLISNPALSRYEYTNTTIEAQSGNASAGSEDRRISISGDSIYPTEKRLFVELRRPSIARSGNHTFEYLGFGPGNYSTGFPLRQEVVLSDVQDFYAQSKKEDAGIVFYTGLNSNGDLYIGNKKINAITGEETFLESAQVRATEEEDGDLGGLVTTFELPVVFERDITVDGDANFNNPVTINVEPAEPSALTIVSNIDFNTGGDQTLDFSSFVFSDIPSNGNIVLTQNNIYSAIFTLNPRGNTSFSGQNYSVRTHVNQLIGNIPTNHTPNQNLTTVGFPVTFGSNDPKSGDILLRGAEVGKTGSIGWIYSNFYDDITTGLFTIQAFNTNTVEIKTQPGTSPIDLNIFEGSNIRFTGFTGRLEPLNGVRPAENVAVDGFEITVPFTPITPGLNEPTLFVTLDPGYQIEVSIDRWKEFGLLGVEAVRTTTEDYGDFRFGVNTLARADHGVDGDQEEGFVSDAVAPRANLDVVGTAWISGKTLQIGGVNNANNNFLNNPLLADRTFDVVDHAFLVGGDSETPSNNATFRISTSNSGRVGINTDFSQLDRTFTVEGDARVSGPVLFEDDLSVNGSTLDTTSQIFNLLSGSPTNPNPTNVNFADRAEELSIANVTTAEQEINIGNLAVGQVFNIGVSSQETSFNVHTNSDKSRIKLGTVDNDDESLVSVVEVGGAYANLSDDLLEGSIFKVYNRNSYFDGDLRVGQALSIGTGIARLQSNARVFNLLTTTTSTINFGLASSETNIGALGGTTNVNNSLNVFNDSNLFGDVVLSGGLNAGEFEIRRGSFGTPITTHAIGDDETNFNIDLYRATPITILLDTEGASIWGDATFKDTTPEFINDPSVYRLVINQVASNLEFEVGSYVLIDRSVQVFGQNTTASPVGEQYSELLEVIGIINLSDVGSDPLELRVRRARNQLDPTASADGFMFAGPDVDGQAAPYRYLRTDHPDNAVLIRYDLNRRVSFVRQPLSAVTGLDAIATGDFSGAVNIGDFFRLSSDENGNLGELTSITQLLTTSEQSFTVTDGGVPALIAFQVDSISGNTYINGKLTVQKSICLEGSTTNNDERLVVTNGTVGNPNTSLAVGFVVTNFTGGGSVGGELTYEDVPAFQDSTATFDVLRDSGGNVSSIIVTGGGTGLVDGQLLTLLAANTGGAPGTDIQITVSAEDLGNDREKFIVDSSTGTTSIRGDLKIGTLAFDRFITEGATGNTTITGGNFVMENDSGDQQLIAQNSSGNLTIAGVIRTQGTGENILAGDLVVRGGDFRLRGDVFGTEETIFAINNDRSIDFADQEGFFTPTGARKWEYIGGGIEVQEVVSNINYFVAPAGDLTLLLPQNASHGDMVRVVDVGGLLTYNLSLRFRSPNGVKIQGDDNNSGQGPGVPAFYSDGGELVVQTPNAALGLVYLGQLDFDGDSTGAPSTQAGWWLMEI